MQIAYLDCFSGMSGDMFLGALIDAGVPARLFEETVEALGIGARLEISRVNRSGISAIKVDVFVNGEKELPREVFWEQQQHKHKHELEHAHMHGHGHSHSHDSHSPQSDSFGGSRAWVPAPHESAPHEHEHSHGRGLKEIKQVISRAAISGAAKKTAIDIFQALGEAESKVHNTSIESIHFHEVGAVDAMVDIVCAAVGAEALGVDEWVCSPLNVGGGTVKCAHGTLPVPAPATVELLKGAPVYSSGLTVELVTPTGAAIVKTLAKRFGTFSSMKVDKTGYGAGTRDFPDHANVVRLTVGEAQAGKSAPYGASEDTRTGAPAPHEAREETIVVLEANIDDLNPQVFGYVIDRLLEEGALDVFGIPVQMKKNRPGMLLTVLCKTEQTAQMTKIIFAETSTLGVRRRDEKRQVLGRKWMSVTTQWGEVRMKVASMNGTVTNYAPEYEDCRRIASEHRVPLKKVMQEAVQAYKGVQRNGS